MNGLRGHSEEGTEPCTFWVLRRSNRIVTLVAIWRIELRKREIGGNKIKQEDGTTAMEEVMKIDQKSVWEGDSVEMPIKGINYCSICQVSVLNWIIRLEGIT